MQFPTLEFALFFLLVYGLYTLALGRPFLRKMILLLASYAFFAFWDWRFVFLLFGISGVNHILAIFIDQKIKKIPDDRRKSRKVLLVLGIGINLGVLAFFKYFLFFATNINTLLNLVNPSFAIPLFPIILPVGISFFTFQGMSYLIDVYKKDIKADHNFLDVLLFISFFPQLVAGPIVRGKDFIPQIKEKTAPPPQEVNRSLVLILGGLIKKMIIANYLGTELVDPVFIDPSSWGSGDLLLAAYAYALQIYCDFSAYSDIAIGIAGLFGFSFPENFRKPYRAHSLQDFWRRWHISLSGWLRDYLYIPLGGSRKGEGKTYRNLMLTMVLGGLWHGASWNFLLWGTLHGGMLSLEHFFQKHFPQKKQSKNGFGTHLKNGLKIIFTFHFIVLTWIFFRSSSLSLAHEFVLGLLSPWQWPSLLKPFPLILLITGVMMHWGPDQSRIWLPRFVSQFHPIIRALGSGLILGAIGLASPPGVAPFIYFQF